MGSKEQGLFKKYEVTKLSNPEKVIDCLVLEFDDPLATQAIATWAAEMRRAGYVQVIEMKLDYIYLKETYLRVLFI